MFDKLLPEMRRFMAALVRYRIGPIAGARRYVELYRRRRFSPNEIHFLNLLDPALTAQGLRAIVSKEELLQVQRQLNDSGQFDLTEDKIVFHRHCVHAGLPVPALYAVFDAAGADEEVRVLRDEASLTVFLAEAAVNELIVKPVDGVHGEGVMRIERGATGWRLADGGPAAAPSLLRAFGATGYRRWMFQQRVHGHPALCALSGASGLQTIRIVTLMAPDGAVRVLAGRLRLISHDGAHDNFDLGRTGNLIANLDLESGQIRNVVGRDPRHASLCSVESHPRTGRRLIGWQVPEWPAARVLAIAAAQAFSPLRTIGWDVALTPDQPCLIEGNVTWDTLIGEARMGAIYEELSRLAAPL